MISLKKSKTSGFSLVELMIVVAIIGVLAALAVPKFQSFQAKARQSEAKTNVSHLYTLEQSYYGDHDTYTNVGVTGNSLAGVAGTATCPPNDIGFNPQPCVNSKIRYQYLVTASSSTAFTGRASSGTGGSNQVVPNCSTADIWEIDATKSLIASADAVAKCQ